MVEKNKDLVVELSDIKRDEQFLKYDSEVMSDNYSNAQKEN